MKKYVFLAIIIICATLVFSYYVSTVEHQYDVTIIDKHIDHSEDGSFYMVTTDKGVFEVNNGLFINVWNADEIYGNLTIGKKYHIRTKGIKEVDFLVQMFPYIVEYKEIQ